MEGFTTTKVLEFPVSPGEWIRVEMPCPISKEGWDRFMMLLGLSKKSLLKQPASTEEALAALPQEEGAKQERKDEKIAIQGTQLAVRKFSDTVKDAVLLALDRGLRPTQVYRQCLEQFPPEQQPAMSTIVNWRASFIFDELIPDKQNRKWNTDPDIRHSALCLYQTGTSVLDAFLALDAEFGERAPLLPGTVYKWFVKWEKQKVIQNSPPPVVEPQEGEKPAVKVEGPRKITHLSVVEWNKLRWRSNGLMRHKKRMGHIRAVLAKEFDAIPPVPATIWKWWKQAQEEEARANKATTSPQTSHILPSNVQKNADCTFDSLKATSTRTAGSEHSGQDGGLRQRVPEAAGPANAEAVAKNEGLNLAENASAGSQRCNPQSVQKITKVFPERKPIRLPDPPLHIHHRDWSQITRQFDLFTNIRCGRSGLPDSDLHTCLNWQHAWRVKCPDGPAKHLESCRVCPNWIKDAIELSGLMVKWGENKAEPDMEKGKEDV